LSKTNQHNMIDTFIVQATLAVLLFLSAMTWSVALWKWRINRRSQTEAKAFENAFWKSETWVQAQALTQSGNAALQDLARTGFDAFEELRKGPRNIRQLLDPISAIERPMRQAMQMILRRQERGQMELATIGSTAPFIGLFGTVWGIMGALKTIGESGQASIDVVAGPIGEALIATAVGIVTAIPAVLLYNYFMRSQKLRITQMEGFIEAFTRMAARQLAFEEGSE
jgi:biopolymer transport protein ExbB